MKRVDGHRNTGVTLGCYASSPFVVTPYLFRGPPWGRRDARGWSVGREAGWTPARGRGDDSCGDIALLPLAGRGLGEGPVILAAPPVAESPSPRPSPLKGRGRRGARAKTKRGPAFPPAPRCRQPLACPSGRRARRGGGKHGPLPARDVEPCVPTVAMRPLAGHRDGDGSEEPRSRLDVLAIPSSLAAIRHRDPVIDRHDPEGRFVRSPRVGPFCPKAFSSVAAVVAAFRPCPKAPPLRCNPLHPVRRRALRPWRSVRPAARKHRPLPFRLSPPTQGREVPLDACPFRWRQDDANIAPAVSRGGVPVPIHAVSRRHLHRTRS